METILDKIIRKKQEEVEQLRDMTFPLIEGAQPKYSLVSRLEKGKDVTIIAEFKRASPSKGDINPTLDPALQARNYIDGGADAVSVLTDKTFFKGSFEDLKKVRLAIQKPILCKDFIIDPIQIDFAKHAGANLILLIAAALDLKKLEYLYEYAKTKNLEVIMEVHNEEETEKVLKTNNPIIGVNNRNLKTFQVDLRTTERLAPLIKGENRFLIGESGITSGSDVERLVRAGANGILVGETLMKHGNIVQGVKELKKPLIEVVK
ncbi:indole-3-glycerol phosphate synthase TrpC [Cytobacillus sp. FJAT-54145]|uniref:Indole-3-glycerol phosphate synthase n=1 Tax=Cytobacillus spartinae TaxID=3299023 RepID=A0ABW6KIN4_9BACI